MSRKRPTEVSWDSDDDLLQEDISGINAFPTAKKDDLEDDLDEDALLGSDDEDATNGGRTTDKQGAINKSSNVSFADDLVEGDVIEILTEEDPSLLMDTSHTDSQEEATLQGDVTAEEVTGMDSTLDMDTTEPEVGGESSESESDDEGRGGRFKSERAPTATVSLSQSKSRSDIPDTLEISEEQQATIDQFLTTGGKQKRQQGKGGQRGGPRGSYQQQQRPGMIGPRPRYNNNMNNNRNGPPRFPPPHFQMRGPLMGPPHGPPQNFNNNQPPRHMHPPPHHQMNQQQQQQQMNQQQQQHINQQQQQHMNQPQPQPTQLVAELLPSLLDPALMHDPDLPPSSVDVLPQPRKILFNPRFLQSAAATGAPPVSGHIDTVPEMTRPQPSYPSSNSPQYNTHQQVPRQPNPAIHQPPYNGPYPGVPQEGSQPGYPHPHQPPQQYGQPVGGPPHNFPPQHSTSQPLLGSAPPGVMGGPPPTHSSGQVALLSLPAQPVFVTSQPRDQQLFYSSMPNQPYPSGHGQSGPGPGFTRHPYPRPGFQGQPKPPLLNQSHDHGVRFRGQQNQSNSPYSMGPPLRSRTPVQQFPRQQQPRNMSPQYQIGHMQRFPRNTGPPRPQRGQMRSPMQGQTRAQFQGQAQPVNNNNNIITVVSSGPQKRLSGDNMSSVHTSPPKVPRTSVKDRLQLPNREQQQQQQQQADQVQQQQPELAPTHNLPQETQQAEEPLDEETRKLNALIEQQKKQREAIIKRKEARRVEQAKQRRQELQKKLAEQGMTLSDVEGSSDNSSPQKPPPKHLQNAPAAGSQNQSHSHGPPLGKRPGQAQEFDVQGGNQGPVPKVSRGGPHPSKFAHHGNQPRGGLQAQQQQRGGFANRNRGGFPRGHRGANRGGPARQMSGGGEGPQNFEQQFQEQQFDMSHSNSGFSPGQNNRGLPGRGRHVRGSRGFPRGGPVRQMSNENQNFYDFSESGPQMANTERSVVTPGQNRGTRGFTRGQRGSTRGGPIRQMSTGAQNDQNAFEDGFEESTFSSNRSVITPGQNNQTAQRRGNLVRGQRGLHRGGPVRRMSGGGQGMPNSQNLNQQQTVNENNRSVISPGQTVPAGHFQAPENQQCPPNQTAQGPLPRGPRSRGRGRGRGASPRGQGHQSPGRGRAGQGQNRMVVTRNAGNNIVLGEAGDPAVNRRIVLGGQKSSGQFVTVDNLSSSTNKARLSKLCNIVGAVENIQVLSSQHKAIVKFAHAKDAAVFQQKFDRSLVDLSHISVSMLPS